MANIQELLDYMKMKSRDRERGQDSLFGSLPQQATMATETIKLRNFQAETQKTILSWEKELLGIYLTDHPLKPYQNYLLERTAQLVSINSEHEGKTFLIGGIIASVKKLTTRKGDPMAFGTLEDLTGSIELVFFPRLWEKHREEIKEDEIVQLKGSVNTRNGNLSMVVEEMKMLDEKIIRKKQETRNKKLASAVASAKRRQENHEEIQDKFNRSITEPDKSRSLETTKTQHSSKQTQEHKTDKIILKLMDNVSKNKMLELKDYLNTQNNGKTRILIRLKGKVIKTPYQVALTDSFQEKLSNFDWLKFEN